MICNNFPNMHHSSAYATLVRTRNMFPFPSFARTAPFVCTCNICPHLHNFTVFGPISLFRLRHFPTVLVYPGRPRPALATPMAWHYSWHLIFFSLAVSCFFLIFRLMLFPHLPLYVRAFRGPVGACVRLCLGDPSRPALPRPGVRAAVELTA